MVEVLPNLPAIIVVLEETLQQLEEEEDFSAAKKADLARNQTIIIDALIDITKFMVASNYKVDILDKVIELKFNDDPMPVNIPKEEKKLDINKMFT